MKIHLSVNILLKKQSETWRKPDLNLPVEAIAHAP